MRVLSVWLLWIVVALQTTAFARDFSASRRLEGGFTDSISAAAGPAGTTLTLETLRGQFVLTRYDAQLEPLWRVPLQGGDASGADWPVIRWHEWRVTPSEVRVFVRRNHELLLQRVRMDTGAATIELMQKVDPPTNIRQEPMSWLQLYSSAAERTHESMMFIKSPNWRFLAVGVAGAANTTLQIYDGDTLNRVRTVVLDRRGVPASIRILDDSSLLMMVGGDDHPITLVHQQHGLPTRRVGLDGEGIGDRFGPVVLHGDESASVLYRTDPGEWRVLRVSFADEKVTSRAVISAQTIKDGLGSRSKRPWKSISLSMYLALDNGDLLLGVRSYSAAAGFEYKDDAITQTPYGRFDAGNMVMARIGEAGDVLWMSEMKSSNVSSWRDGVQLARNVDGDALRALFRSNRGFKVAQVDLNTGNITGPTVVGAGLLGAVPTPGATVPHENGGWVVALRREKNTPRSATRHLVRVEGPQQRADP